MHTFLWSIRDRIHQLWIGESGNCLARANSLRRIAIRRCQILCTYETYSSDEGRRSLPSGALIGNSPDLKHDPNLHRTKGGTSQEKLMTLLHDPFAADSHPLSIGFTGRQLEGNSRLPDGPRQSDDILRLSGPGIGALYVRQAQWDDKMSSQFVVWTRLIVLAGKETSVRSIDRGRRC